MKIIEGDIEEQGCNSPTFTCVNGELGTRTNDGSVADDAQSTQRAQRPADNPPAGSGTYKLVPFSLAVAEDMEATTRGFADAAPAVHVELASNRTALTDIVGAKPTPTTVMTTLASPGLALMGVKDVTWPVI